MNPFRRISITGTEAQVLHKAAQITNLGADLRNGAIAPTEARQRLQRQVHGVVTVVEAWRVYEQTIKATWQTQARSVWKHRLKGTFGALACVDVTESLMKRWQKEQEEKGLAPATINNAYQVLRAALRLMVGDGRLDRLPWGDYKPPAPDAVQEKEACRSIDELALLVRAACRWDEKARSLGRYADMAFRVLLMALTGMRQAEASGLGWDDVHLEGGMPTVTIRHQARDGWRRHHPDWERPLDPPKGREVAAVHLSASAVKAFLGQRENLEAHGRYRANGPVFPGKGGAWRSHADCIDSEDFKLIVADSGLPKGNWSPHSLRHTKVTLESLAHGSDLKSVQAMARHKELKTTERYFHPGGRGLAQSKLEPLDARDMPRPPPRQLPPHEALRPELAVFEVHAEAARAAGDIVGMTTAASADAEQARLERKKETRKEARRKFFGRNIPDYSEVYKAWDGKGERPPAITKAAEDGRQRARNAWLREHPGQVDDANRAGQRSFRATLASWARFVKGRGGRKQVAA